MEVMMAMVILMMMRHWVPLDMMFPNREELLKEILICILMPGLALSESLLSVM